MSGFNLPPGCSVSDIPGNSAEDARYEKALEESYETLENDLEAFKDALDGHLDAPDEQMRLFQMMWVNSCWSGQSNGPKSAQESLIARWVGKHMDKAAERMAEKACEYGPDDSDTREERE